MSSRTLTVSTLFWAVAVLCGAQGAQPVLKPLASSHWPLTPQDTVLGVAMAGDLCVVSVRHGLRVISLANPDTPMQVGSYQSDRYGNKVCVQGPYAYWASWGYGPATFGLEVIDISDPGRPVRVGDCNIDLGDFATALQVRGNYAYLASDSYGFFVFDIADPRRPVLARTYPYIQYFERGFSIVGFDVSDNYACLNSSKLLVMDIRNPTNMVRLGAYNIDSVDTQIVGNHAFVAGFDGSQGLQVLDLSDPTKPVLVGRCCTNEAELADIHVEGGYAYIGGSELQVVDIHDPTQPRPVGRLDAGWITALYASSNRVHVADGTLSVVDASNPAQLKGRGTFDIRGSAEVVRVEGNYAYLANGDGGLQVIDVRDIENPRPVGRHLTPRPAISLDVADGFAYVGMSLGVEVFDVRTPTAPILVASIPTIGPGNAPGDVQVVNNYLYATAFYRGALEIFHVANPSNPVRVASMSIPYGLQIQIVGNHLYHVGDGLRIIDISNPSSPVQLTHYDLRVYDVFVSGQYAYLVADPDESDPFLRVLDVSNPSAPVEMGRADFSGRGWHSRIQVSGRFAYVTGRDEDYYPLWTVYDVGDPWNPRVAHVQSERDIRSLDVAGDVMYLAQGAHGLGIIPTIPNVQFTFKVQSTAGVPLAIESNPVATDSLNWTTVFQTNPPGSSFYYTDLDIRGAPRKFYRVSER